MTLLEQTCLWSYPRKPDDGKEYVYNYEMDDWESLDDIIQKRNV
jgi:hypothetical protein